MRYRIQHIMLTSFDHISVDIMSLPDTMMAVVVHGKGEQLSFCLTIAIKVEKAIDDLNNLNHILEHILDQILDYRTVLWHSEDYRMEEVPVPRPGPGEVLVKVNRFFLGADLVFYFLHSYLWMPKQVKMMGEKNNFFTWWHIRLRRLESVQGMQRHSLELKGFGVGRLLIWSILYNQFWIHLIIHQHFDQMGLTVRIKTFL